MTEPLISLLDKSNLIPRQYQDVELHTLSQM